MRGWGLVVVLALMFLGTPALAGAQISVCGVLRPCDQPPPPPPGPVTLKTEHDPLVIGEQVHLYGTVPENDPRVEADLHAQKWPYTQPPRRIDVDSITTSYEFGFYHAPTLNTRYTVVLRARPERNAPEKRSGTAQVLVFPRLKNFEFEVPRAYVAKSHFVYQFPPDFAFGLDRRRVRWYIKKRGSKALLRMKVTRTRATRTNRVIGRARFRLPRGRYRFITLFCFDIAPGQDVGLGEREARCPKGRRPPGSAFNRGLLPWQ